MIFREAPDERLWPLQQVSAAEERTGAFSFFPENTVPGLAHLRSVLVSDLPDHSLQRYLNYYLAEICKRMPEAQPVDEKASSFFEEPAYYNELSEALDFILQVYPEAGSSLQVPLVYLQKKRAQHADALSGLSDCIDRLHDCRYTICLKQYLSKVGTSKKVTFYALRYFQFFITTLSEHLCSETMCCSDLEEHLLVLNFNDLTYFSLYQENTESLLRSLSPEQAFRHVQRQSEIAASHLGGRLDGCYPQFPALAQMISQWLSEKQKMLLSAFVKIPDVSPKIQLTIPVSYIALLIKLVHANGWTGDVSLSDLFAFVSKHVSSKRQPIISKASLSKEYYSVSQSTAARVLDKLSSMCQSIRRDFFPG